ncbi:MAG: phospholipase D-like domain-containing protein [Pirellulaceae bacterium]|nr:phospholipase D-like domain-containing protein [Pirellulaceae bacterium]
MWELLERSWPYLLFTAHMTTICLASAHVVLTKRDVRAAIGWVGIIWLTPFVGTILYFTLGINRIHRKARRMRGGLGHRDSSPGFRHVSQDVVQRVLGDDGHLAPLVGYIGRLARQPLLDGNSIRTLVGGRAAYDEMLAAITGAKSSIAVESYIFDNDPLGRKFAAALAAARGRGVEVRVLIDSVGARYTWPTIRHYLRKLQVPCASFLPTLLPGKLHYTNLRNHRKIMVVDGQIGFTGGMNIRQGHLCEPGERHPVQDTHFRLEGPIVAQLRETFAADWEFASGEVLDNPAWFPHLTPRGQSLCRGIADGPDLDSGKIQLAILGAIGCARNSLDIMTPYFLPDLPLITALNVAAMRGVAVNIILPEENNLALVQWASTAQLWQVLQRGCRVWLAPAPFDHSKLMVVDGIWSFFGSANWDPRSLRLNFEFNVESYDRDLAGELAALILNKRKAGREITLAEVDARPLWQRLRDGVARLAMPYL